MEEVKKMITEVAGHIHLHSGLISSAPWRYEGFDARNGKQIIYKRNGQKVRLTIGQMQLAIAGIAFEAPVGATGSCLFVPTLH